MYMQTTLIYTDNLGNFIVTNVVDSESTHILPDYYDTPELAKSLCEIGELEYLCKTIELSKKCRTGMRPYTSSNVLDVIQVCEYANEHCFVYSKGVWVYVNYAELKQFLLNTVEGS